MNKTNSTGDIKRIKRGRSIEIKSLDGLTPAEARGLMLEYLVDNELIEL